MKKPFDKVRDNGSKRSKGALAGGGDIGEYTAVASLRNSHFQLPRKELKLPFLLDDRRRAVPERIVKRTVIAIWLPAWPVIGRSIPRIDHHRLNYAHIAHIDAVLHGYLETRGACMCGIGKPKAKQLCLHQLFIIPVFEIVFLIGRALECEGFIRQIRRPLMEGCHLAADHGRGAADSQQANTHCKHALDCAANMQCLEGGEDSIALRHSCGATKKVVQIFQIVIKVASGKSYDRRCGSMRVFKENVVRAKIADFKINFLFVSVSDHIEVFIQHAISVSVGARLAVICSHCRGDLVDLDEAARQFVPKKKNKNTISAGPVLDGAADLVLLLLGTGRQAQSCDQHQENREKKQGAAPWWVKWLF